MTTTSALTGPLLNSCSPITPRSMAYIQDMFNKYDIKSYAILVDHTTIAQDLSVMPQHSICGFYTFDINLAEKNIGEYQVKLLSPNNPKPVCGGWLVASTSRAAAFSLAQALKLTENEDQVIIRYYGGQTTQISAYMDMFSGDSETIIYLNHYFDRKYRTIFPIDVRYMVCNCDGTIVRSGQKIVNPGAITIFDSKEMNLGNFEGYLRVEMEVENLQTRVQPFIHFWADYISDAGMCRNHQSGWSPHPPDTIFNRGYLPLDPNLEAIVSIYNENSCSVTVKALLHYNQQGLDKTVTRLLNPVQTGKMSFQNISELFQDISFEGVESAYIILTCDKPLHRPNHYIAIKNTLKFVDTYHQTSGKACHVAIPSYQYQQKKLSYFNNCGLQAPWIIRLPILDNSFGIDTFMGLLSLTICDQSEFEYSFLNVDGNEIHRENIHLDTTSPQFINVSNFAKARNIDISGGGMFCLSPSKDVPSVPRNSTIFFGLKHVNFPYISTSFRGSPAEVNLPFYISGRVPMSREYDFSPLQITDHFVPGIVSEEYDSIIIVKNSSLMKDYNNTAQYLLEIIDYYGNTYTLHRTVLPNSHDTFKLSSILKTAGITSDKPYYTIWIKCLNTKLKPFHLLYRKCDHALSFDDGSEGTLQKKPQISGIDSKDNNISSFELERFFKETGVSSL